MKPFGKETQLLELDVEQFTALLVSAAETKGYLAAMKEQEVVSRIFQDSEGILLAGMQPCRAKSAKEVDDWAKQLKSYFAQGGQGEVVLAAAVFTNGEYKKV